MANTDELFSHSTRENIIDFIKVRFKWRISILKNVKQ